MKYLVLGAGMMGSATAHDLATTNPDAEIMLADINLSQAKQTASAIGPNVVPIRLDVNENGKLIQAMEGVSAVVSASSYTFNFQITKAAIEAGVSMCDLGGNNDVVDKQISLHEKAKERGVTIIPNCGLAPGLINILAIEGAKSFSELDSIHLRVGGLPQHPRPPLFHQITFSVDGLINEYVEKAIVIRGGEIVGIDSMSEIEKIEFEEPFNNLEAFNTSGGISTLARVLDGKVKELDYKTIRYKGHCEKFKTLLELGFATAEPMMVGGSVKTNREFFTDLLRKKLDVGGKDVVLARATISGRTKEAEKTLVYEFIDYFDDGTRMTAMMRTTAFPTSIIAQMLASRLITETGVMPPEACVPGNIMIQELGKRNIRISKKVTEFWR